MITSVTIPSDAAYKSKPWVAQVTGRHPKFKFARDFCSSTVTQPGVYCASAVSKGKEFTKYFAVVNSPEGLVRLHIGDESLALLVDKHIDNMEEVFAFKDEDGGWAIRKDGQINTQASSKPADVIERAQNAFKQAVKNAPGIEFTQARATSFLTGAIFGLSESGRLEDAAALQSVLDRVSVEGVLVFVNW